MIAWIIIAYIASILITRFVLIYTDNGDGIVMAILCFMPVSNLLLSCACLGLLLDDIGFWDTISDKFFKR